MCVCLYSNNVILFTRQIPAPVFAGLTAFHLLKLTGDVFAVVKAHVQSDLKYGHIGVQ